jgi:predicted acyltransferase
LNLRVVWQVVIAVALLIGYWLLLTFIPFASHAAGTLEPHANVAMAVDEFVLGRFRDGTTYTWVLSSMTFAASVMLGVFAGYVLRSTRTQWQKVALLIGLGAASLAAGYVWAVWLDFPIIKHIWTSSMTLWAAGWSYLLLALFYVAIDIVGFRRWVFPFVVIGMNAITAYVAWHFIPFEQMAKTLLGGLASHLGAWGPFLVSFAACGLCWLILYDLFRRRVFLRI